MGASPYAAAIATLKRCHAGLAGYPSPDERAMLLRLHAEALAVLEAGHERRRLSTASLAARVQRLEQQLADRDPGERAAIIRQRLGLSKSRYYELRRKGPDKSGLSVGMLVP